MDVDYLYAKEKNSVSNESAVRRKRVKLKRTMHDEVSEIINILGEVKHCIPFVNTLFLDFIH